MTKQDFAHEKTVVLVKTDGVRRGLIGEILQRFEKVGLKIVALKMVWVDKDMVAKHYPDSRTELLEGIGKKTLATYEKYGRDPKEELGTMVPLEIGRMVNKWNMEFLSSGPVVAVLIQGLHAIDNVRMMAGHTLPTFAEPGTIRGDYSIDSPVLANERKRTVRNVMHASGNLEEAKYEEELWFKKEEIYDYKRSDEEIMFE
ncbi:nucleoside-diphosphate kinase [Patescibacteria group bacterium]|nr:nucleoside-diphosphate kinase [Patescibacteria group bacterium]MBU1890321.1 nucleoside-diphosphate kinase [Patescibacteria group bacterium]